MGSFETKSFKCEFKAEEEPGHVVGHAAVFDVVDLGGDVIEKGAFKRTLDQKGPWRPMLWYHKPDEPLGKAKCWEDETGLAFDAWMNLDVSRAREVYSLIKQEAINGMSIGYDPMLAPYVDGVRHLKEVRLWEVSPVTFPMNPDARAEAKNIDSAVEALLASAGSYKVGRVLSKVNKEALRQAVSILQGLLSRAGDEEDSEKSHSFDSPAEEGLIPADVSDPELRSLREAVAELRQSVR